MPEDAPIARTVTRLASRGAAPPDETPPPGPSPYLKFDRRSWAALRENTPLSLSDADIAALRGLNEPVSAGEVIDVYLPLSRLLNLHVAAARRLVGVEADFLGRPTTAAPYVIGVAGSVAVGKSTFARLLQAVLARWPDHPRVALVTTDGFLYPTAELERRGLMRRKGFPESYDLKRMLAFLAALKAGEKRLEVPVYSHQGYDIVPGEMQVIEQPDVLIFEGLNVLQAVSSAPLVASDFFDFSVYIDAEQSDIAGWYVERFLLLQRTAFQNPASYFHHYKDLTRPEAVATARDIWRRTNLPNLRDNIHPTRERARLVLRKDASHVVQEIWLRRV